MKILIVLAFIVFDFVSGIILALKKSSFISKKMRKGLYNKSGELLLLALAYMISFAMKYFEIGYSNSFYIIVSTYIIIMEISSILENIGQLNPKLVPSVIRKCFKTLKGSGTNEN